MRDIEDRRAARRFVGRDLLGAYATPIASHYALPSSVDRTDKHNIVTAFEAALHHHGHERHGAAALASHARAASWKIRLTGYILKP